MEILKIDAGKCTRDGLCALDCAASIIRLPDDGSVPEAPAEAENFCLDCGHCVAVCPHGALSHARIPIEVSPAISAELRIDADRALQFLRSRRSIRHYLEKGVAQEKIEQLIAAARYAPSAGNSQMVEWLVLTEKKRIRDIAGLALDWLRELVKNPRVAAASPYLVKAVAAWDAGYDSVLRDAPVLIVASAPAEALNGTVDITLALSYLDLYAPALGLGTCWAGILHAAMVNSPAVKSAVGIPAGHPHHYAMMLGYPAVEYFRLPERRKPRIVFA